MKRKEDHLPHLHEDMFQPLIFRWVNFLTLTLRSANHKGKITFESSTSTAIGFQSNSPGKLKPQNDGFFSMGFPKISFKKREWDPFFLVGGWTNPFEKYDRQIGNLPQIGLKIQNIWVATTQFFLENAQVLGTI